MVFSAADQRYMRLALEEAQRALDSGDVPVGALAVWNGEIIGRGHNQREAQADPTAHAEMLALRQAAAHIGSWRLDGVTLYCTLEPCAMCAGAMVLARLARLVFGAYDSKAGAAGSVLDITRHPGLNHCVRVQGGLYEAAAAAQLRRFFRELRAGGRG